MRVSNHICQKHMSLCGSESCCMRMHVLHKEGHCVSPKTKKTQVDFGSVVSLLLSEPFALSWQRGSIRACLSLKVQIVPNEPRKLELIF